MAVVLRDITKEQMETVTEVLDENEISYVTHEKTKDVKVGELEDGKFHWITVTVYDLEVEA